MGHQQSNLDFSTVDLRCQKILLKKLKHFPSMTVPCFIRGSPLVYPNSLSQSSLKTGLRPQHLWHKNSVIRWFPPCLPSKVTSRMSLIHSCQYILHVPRNISLPCMMKIDNYILYTDVLIMNHNSICIYIYIQCVYTHVYFLWEYILIAKECGWFTANQDVLHAKEVTSGHTPKFIYHLLDNLSPSPQFSILAMAWRRTDQSLTAQWRAPFPR